MLDLLMLSALVYIASKSGKKKRKKQFRLFKPVRIKKSKYDTWAYNPNNENASREITRECNSAQRNRLHFTGNTVHNRQRVSRFWRPLVPAHRAQSIRTHRLLKGGTQWYLKL